ncbi:hypothetical protein L218DRAFT_661926 [Marasmius fiardii PR-910]|nr:hypothetical protein L218DRAFT_661926 [Marasmius fiardii PR-910]
MGSMQNSGNSRSPSKRRAFVDGDAAEEISPCKRPRGPVLCFRCGTDGHLTADCTASVTKAGTNCATTVKQSRGRMALMAPNGKRFCFKWAQNSSCDYGNACLNYHGCSISNGSDHGAEDCKHTRHS